ncbi:hypothetical protein AAMO2058_001704000 [Amorphochlora amoebiformis]
MVCLCFWAINSTQGYYPKVVYTPTQIVSELISMVDLEEVKYAKPRRSGVSTFNYSLTHALLLVICFCCVVAMLQRVKCPDRDNTLIRYEPSNTGDTTNSPQPKSKPTGSVPKSKLIESVPPKSKPTESVPPKSKPIESVVPPKSKPTESVPPKPKPIESVVPPKSKPIESVVPPKSKPTESVPPKPKPIESVVPPKSKPIESVVPPKSKPTESVPPKPKPIESVVPPKSKPIESIPPKSKPTESVPPKSKPIESVPPKSKLTESVPPKSKPIESVPPKSKPTESVPPKSKPIESVPPKSKPTESVPPKSKPIESVPPKSKPTESVPPKSKPIESVPPKSNPTESVPPKSKPTESVPPKSKPTESVTPKSKPIESVPPKSKPTESVTPISKPTESVPSKPKPTGAVPTKPEQAKSKKSEIHIEGRGGGRGGENGKGGGYLSGGRGREWKREKPKPPVDVRDEVCGPEHLGEEYDWVFKQNSSDLNKIQSFSQSKFFYSNPNGPINKQARLVNAKIRPSNDYNNPLVAVCYGGIARSFVSPIVYKSTKHFLLDRLSTNTHVIATVKLQADPGKANETDELSRYEAYASSSRKSVERALSYLNPTVSYIMDTNETTRMEYNCKLDSSKDPYKLYSRDEKWARRFLVQMKDLWNCMKQVEHLEASNNIRFEAIVRARTDSVWLRPLGLSARRLLEERGENITTFWDHFIFAPRKAAEIFSRFWDRYSDCSTTWDGPYSQESSFETYSKEIGVPFVGNFYIPTAVKRRSRSMVNSAFICLIQKCVTQEECMNIVYMDEKEK